jgi:hypothetical protein
VRMHSVIRHWLSPQYVLSGEKPIYPPKRMRSGASISLRCFYGKDLRLRWGAVDRHVHKINGFLRKVTGRRPHLAVLAKPVSVTLSKIC